MRPWMKFVWVPLCLLVILPTPLHAADSTSSHRETPSRRRSAREASNDVNSQTNLYSLYQKLQQDKQGLLVGVSHFYFAKNLQNEDIFVLYMKNELENAAETMLQLTEYLADSKLLRKIYYDSSIAIEVLIYRSEYTDANQHNPIGGHPKLKNPEDWAEYITPPQSTSRQKKICIIL